MIWQNVRCGGLEVEYLPEMQVQSPLRAKKIIPKKLGVFRNSEKM